MLDKRELVIILEDRIIQLQDKLDEDDFYSSSYRKETEDSVARLQQLVDDLN